MIKITYFTVLYFCFKFSYRKEFITASWMVETQQLLVSFYPAVKTSLNSWLAVINCVLYRIFGRTLFSLEWIMTTADIYWGLTVCQRLYFTSASQNYFFPVTTLWRKEGDLCFTEIKEAHKDQRIHPRSSLKHPSWSSSFVFPLKPEDYAGCIPKASELNAKTVNFMVCELYL